MNPVIACLPNAPRHGGRPKHRKLLGDVRTFENLPEHRDQLVGIKRLTKKGDIGKDGGKIRAIIARHKDEGSPSLAKGLGHW